MQRAYQYHDTPKSMSRLMLDDTIAVEFKSNFRSNAFSFSAVIVGTFLFLLLIRVSVMRESTEIIYSNNSKFLDEKYGPVRHVAVVSSLRMTIINAFTKEKVLKQEFLE